MSDKKNNQIHKCRKLTTHPYDENISFLIRDNSYHCDHITPPNELIDALKNGDVNKYNEIFENIRKPMNRDKWGNKKYYFVFEGIDLSGINLENIKLCDVYMSNTNLSKANLRNSYFDRVVLSESNLKQGNFSYSIFTNTGFTSSNLSNANFSNTFLSCGFTKTNLKGADFKFSNISNFYDSDLSYADLRYTSNPISFEGPINSQTLFNGSFFEYKPDYIREGKQIPISDNIKFPLNLIKMICEIKSDNDEIKDIQKTLLPFAAKFFEPDYIDIDALEETENPENIIPPSDAINFLKNGDTEKWNRWYFKISDNHKSFLIDLQKLKLTDVKLKGVELSNTNLSGAEFIDCDFSGNPRSSFFINTNFEQSNFKRTDFSNAAFIKAGLKNAGFSECKLEKANFVRADIERAQFDNNVKINTDCAFDKQEIDSHFDIEKIYGLIYFFCFLKSDSSEIVTLQKKLVKYINKYLDVMNFTDKRLDEVAYFSHHEIKYFELDNIDLSQYYI